MDENTLVPLGELSKSESTAPSNFVQYIPYGSRSIFNFVFVVL